MVLIKNMLYGTSDAEPQTDIIVAQLAQELYNSNLLLLLIQNLNRIDFEVRDLKKLMFCACYQKKKLPTSTFTLQIYFDASVHMG